MARVFLSYRRDDSAGFAGRLTDALEAEFGADSVFRDVDDIRPGEDFLAAIEAQLRQVDAVLVMIGPHWLATGADGRSRLDAANDVVRREIEAALASGKPVIPVLVGGAAMPAEDALPDSIAALARRNAVTLPDSGWRDAVQRLAVSLPLPAGAAEAARAQGAGAKAGKSPRVPVRALGTAGAVLVVALGVFAALRLQESPLPPSPTPAADVAGRWVARVKYDWGDEHDEVFEFRYLGDSLHGTATYQTGRLTIEHASVEGEWLRFVTRSQQMLGNEAPWKEVTHRYTGQVTPEAIRFTLESGGGYTIHTPVEFTARRAAP
jgi:hypothetical protein